MANAYPPEQGGRAVVNSVNTMELINLMEGFTKKAPAWTEIAGAGNTKEARVAYLYFLRKASALLRILRTTLCKCSRNDWMTISVCVFPVALTASSSMDFTSWYASKSMDNRLRSLIFFNIIKLNISYILPFKQ